MYRLAIRLLVALLIFLLLLSGAALLLFTDRGNALLKPYVQTQLREATGLPLELKRFTLRWRTLHADVVMPGAALRVDAAYDPFRLRYAGDYRVKAKQFTYQKYTLSQADVKGRFHGRRDDVSTSGKGTLLGAPVAYSVAVDEGRVRKLEALTKGTPVAQILAAAGMPPLAEGEADLKIDMPTIGKEGAKGYARLEVARASLNRVLIQKRFGYLMPQNDRLSLHAEAKLDSEHIDFDAKIRSSLLNATVEKGRYDTKAEKMQAVYRADVQELGVLTTNRLHGPLALSGELHLDHGLFGITGRTKTFGGKIDFAFAKGVQLRLQEVSVPKLLKLAGIPNLLDGRLEGKVQLAQLNAPEGNFALNLKHAVPKRKRIEKLYGIALPDYGIFTADVSGKINKEVLAATAKLHSGKIDLKLPSLHYALTSGRLKTEYRAAIHTPAGEVRSKGKADYKKQLSLEGVITGLGKKVTYRYDGTKASFDAPAAEMEKLAALAGLPVYVRGRAGITVHISDIKRLEGTYAVKSKKLRLNPKTMKQLTGKALDWPLAVDTSGKMHNKHLYGGATVTMRQGTLKISALDFNTNSAALFAKYRLDIPELARLAVLTGKPLHGKMLLAGTLRQHNGLHLDGTTQSLGGSVAYRLDNTLFQATLASVPMSRLLAMMGYPQYFMGALSGKVRYGLKSKRGNASMRIAGFRIKPSPLTQALAKIFPKDPTRIIYKTTTLNATFAPNRVRYTLHARGSRSRLDITDGRVDTRSGKQYAKLKFVYEKYTIYGTIGGTTAQPKFTLDASKLIEQKVEDAIRKKVEKKWGKGAGALLKGLGL